MAANIEKDKPEHIEVNIPDKQASDSVEESLIDKLKKIPSKIASKSPKSPSKSETASPFELVLGTFQGNFLGKVPGLSWFLGYVQEHHPQYYKPTLAEATATSIFVAVGCGICVTSNDLINTALGFGALYMALFACFGQSSGAHLNPAVTIGLWIYGKINYVRAVIYIIAQLGGAAFGATVLSKTLPRNDQVCNTELQQGITFLQGTFVEMISTFLIVLVVCVAKAKKSLIAPVHVGFTLMAMILFSFRLTQSSMNFARWLGPAYVEDKINWTDLPTYIIGPVIGGILAGIWAWLYIEAEVEEEEEGAKEGEGAQVVAVQSSSTS